MDNNGGYFVCIILGMSVVVCYLILFMYGFLWIFILVYIMLVVFWYKNSFKIIMNVCLLFIF